jgi:glycerol-3-phosphate acyltransferase PlsY
MLPLDICKGIIAVFLLVGEESAVKKITLAVQATVIIHPAERSGYNIF